MASSTGTPPPSDSRWATFKDRLAIVVAITAVALLFFMLIDGGVFNFDCSFADFVTFTCNRWSAGPPVR